jgi:hypothetical protein
MHIKIVIPTMFLAALLVTGFATAAIPTPVGGQITDSVTQVFSHRINGPDMTAAGAWNNQVWGNGEVLVCNDLEGRRVCYHGRPVLTGMFASSKVSCSDVPDNMLSLLTALKNQNH